MRGRERLCLYVRVQVHTTDLVRVLRTPLCQGIAAGQQSGPPGLRKGALSVAQRLAPQFVLACDQMHLLDMVIFDFYVDNATSMNQFILRSKYYK